MTGSEGCGLCVTIAYARYQPFGKHMFDQRRPSLKQAVVSTQGRQSSFSCRPTRLRGVEGILCGYSQTLHTELLFRSQARGMLTHEALLLSLKPKRGLLLESKRAELARDKQTYFLCNEPHEIEHKHPLAASQLWCQRPGKSR